MEMRGDMGKGITLLESPENQFTLTMRIIIIITKQLLSVLLYQGLC